MIYQKYGTKCNKFLSQRTTKDELKGDIDGLKGDLDGVKVDMESNMDVLKDVKEAKMEGLK